eukprot:7955650-Alexandrium_andersonii.AAC.1
MPAGGALPWCAKRARTCCAALSAGMCASKSHGRCNTLRARGRNLRKLRCQAGEEGAEAVAAELR